MWDDWQMPDDDFEPPPLRVLLASSGPTGQGPAIRPSDARLRAMARQCRTQEGEQTGRFGAGLDSLAVATSAKLDGPDALRFWKFYRTLP